MPRIPVYESGIQQTTSAPAVEHSYVPGSYVPRALGNVLGQAFDIGVKFDRAQEAQKYINNSLDARQKLNSLVNEANNYEGDLEKFPVLYKNQINNIVNKAKSGLGGEWKTEADRVLGGMGITAQSKIDNIYQKKVAKRGKEVSANLDSAFLDSYSQAQTPTEQNQVLDDYLKGKKLLYDTGQISQKEYSELKYNMPKMMVERLIQDNPYRAVNMLMSKDSLPILRAEKPKEVEKLKSEAFRALNQRRKYINEQLSSQMIDGNLSFGDVASAYERGDLSESQFKKWEKAFNVPQELTSLKPDPESFSKAMVDFADNKGDVNLSDMLFDGSFTIQELATINNLKKAMAGMTDEQKGSIFSYIKMVDGATNDPKSKSNIYHNLLAIAERTGYDYQKVKQTMNDTEMMRIHTTYPQSAGLDKVPDIIVEKGNPYLSLRFGRKPGEEVGIYIPEKNAYSTLPGTSNVMDVYQHLYNAAQTEKSNEAHAKLAKNLDEKNYLSKLFDTAINSMNIGAAEIGRFLTSTYWKGVNALLPEGYKANTEDIYKEGVPLYQKALLPEFYDEIIKNGNKYINSLKTNEKGVKEWALEAVDGAGKMAPGLMGTMTVGGIMQALVGAGETSMVALRNMPALMKALNNIVKSKLVLGSLTESVYGRSLENKPVLKKIEDIAGDIATSYAIVYNMPWAKNWAKRLLSRVIAFTGYGVGHANYQSLVDNGRPLTAEEMKAVTSHSLGAGIMFEGMNALVGITQDARAKAELETHIDKINKALEAGNFADVAEELDKAKPLVEKEIASLSKNVIGQGEVIQPQVDLSKLSPLEADMYRELAMPGRILSVRERMLKEELENKARVNQGEKKPGIIMSKEGQKGRKGEVIIPNAGKPSKLIVPGKEAAEEGNVLLGEKGKEAVNPEESYPAEQPVNMPNIKEEGGKISVDLPVVDKAKEGNSRKWFVKKETMLGIPIFQGGKRNTIDLVKQVADQVFTPEGKSKITEIHDLFGGSGMYGTALSEALELPNVKKIVISEKLDPYREAIKYLLERGNKFYEDLGNVQKDIDNIKNISSSEDKSKGVIGRSILSYIDSHELDPNSRGVLLTMYKRTTSDYGKSDTSVDNIDDLMAQTGKDIMNAWNLLKRVRERGVKIEVKKGDAYELGKNLSGKHILAVVDPPYYMTTGYTPDGKKIVVDNNTYMKTLELLQSLKNKGTNVIYNDSAWWLKDKYEKDWQEGKKTLENILKLGYNWHVTGGLGKGRNELLGVHNARAEEKVVGQGNTGRNDIGNIARSEEGVKPGGLGGSGGKPGEVQGEVRKSAEGKRVILPSEKKENKNVKIYFHSLDLPTDKFYEHTIKPGVKELKEGAKALGSSVQDLFAPESKSEKAYKASLSIREALGKKALAMERFAQEHQKRWDYWNKKSEADNLKFMDLMEGQGSTGNADIDKLVKPYRVILDKAYEMSKALYDKIKYREDYFPHIWENPKKAEEFFKRYKNNIGKEAFSKMRDIDLIKEGIKAGLKLKYDNVEDIVAARVSSAISAKAKADMLDMLEKEGFISKEKEEGKSFIDTPKGRYYGDADIIKLIDRKMQQSVFSKDTGWGKAARGMLNAKNALLTFKLGLNTFHGIMTTVSDMNNQLVLAAKSLGRGDFGEMLKRLAQIPASPITGAKLGGKLRNAYMYGAKTPEEQEFVKIMTGAGGRVKMPSIYRIQAQKAYKKALKQGDLIGAGFKLVPRILEALQKPILEEYVPRLKVAKFWQTYKDWAVHHPEATEGEKKEYASKLWDSLDNRLGELVYDNLFWHRLMRDTAVMSTLSLGWNLGSFREAGGAVKDLAQLLNDARKGAKNRHFVDRMLFVATYPIMAGMVGGLINAIMTGKKPQSIKDLYFPRTGNKNPDGSDERITLPSYMKDVYSYANAIKNRGLVQGLMTVAGHKASPLLGGAIDLLRNQDYYGVMIRNPRDPVLQQAKDLGKWFLDYIKPISVASSERMEGAKKVLPYIGLSKAPSYVVRTKIQNDIYNLLSKEYKPAMTRSEYERKLKERDLIKEIQGLPRSKAVRLVLKAQKEGILGDNPDTARRRARRIFRNLGMPSDVVAFKMLSKDNQEWVWGKMTIKEKGRYYPGLHKELQVKLVNRDILKEMRNARKGNN